MQNIILALETSTDACSVTICAPHKTCNTLVVEPHAHSKLLLQMVEQMCAEAGISLSQVAALAYGSGPGSFTGVRIAASVVQGLAFGVGKPVIAVSSLQALAQQVYDRLNVRDVLAVLDARMQEVYWGCYQAGADGLMQAITADQVQKPASLSLDSAVVYTAVGTGCAVYADLLLANNPSLIIDHSVQFPRAQEVAKLALAKFASGELLAPGAAVPTYVRNQVVQK